MELTKEEANAILNYLYEVEAIAQAEMYWLKNWDKAEPIVSKLEEFAKAK